MRICVGVVLVLERLFSAAWMVVKLAPLAPTVTTFCPVTLLQSWALPPPPLPAEPAEPDEPDEPPAPEPAELPPAPPLPVEPAAPAVDEEPACEVEPPDPAVLPAPPTPPDPEPVPAVAFVPAVFMPLPAVLTGAVPAVPVGCPPLVEPEPAVGVVINRRAGSMSSGRPMECARAQVEVLARVASATGSRYRDEIGARLWRLAGVCGGFKDWTAVERCLDVAADLGYGDPRNEHWLVRAVAAFDPATAIRAREMFIRTLKPALRAGQR